MMKSGVAMGPMAARTAFFSLLFDNVYMHTSVSECECEWRVASDEQLCFGVC